MKLKHFLSITDLTAKEIWEIFFLTKKLKKELKEKGSNEKVLKDKYLALLFEKQSLRTRVSFEIGMMQLGGSVVYLDPKETGIGLREPEADIAKVLSTMVNAIAARTNTHQTLLNIAESSTIPVINALSDLEHPCQALADLFTIWEIKGEIKEIKIAFVGDGENNVTHSLCLISSMLGATFSCGSPQGYSMNKDIFKKAQILGGNITGTNNPKVAVKDADVVITDTWVSMGDEKEKEKRLKIFKSYQVNSDLMALAKKDAIFMHCLPAYRGNEVTADVIDGKQSVVFQEAENRLHAQKALLIFLLKTSY